VMFDPDAPSRQDPKYGPWLHWLSVNVPGSDLAQGDNLAQYVGAGPPQGTGLHRYVVLAYKQEHKGDPKELQSFHKAGDRPKWELKKFCGKAEKHTQMGALHLVAGNFFEAQWDDYVPTLYKNLERLGKVSKKRKNWLPLESNPELMTKYVHALGVPKKNWFFTRCWAVMRPSSEWSHSPFSRCCCCFLSRTRARRIGRRRKR